MTFTTKVSLLAVGTLILVIVIGGLAWRGCHYQQKLEVEREKVADLEGQIDGLKTTVEALTSDAEKANQMCAQRIASTRESYKLELEACQRVVTILEKRDAKAEELEKDVDALVDALRNRVDN